MVNMYSVSNIIFIEKIFCRNEEVIFVQKHVNLLKLLTSCCPSDKQDNRNALRSVKILFL